MKTTDRTAAPATKHRLAIHTQLFPQLLIPVVSPPELDAVNNAANVLKTFQMRLVNERRKRRTYVR